MPENERRDFHLFIDEFHNFKNLMLYTKLSRMPGLSTSDARRAFDTFAKIRYIQQVNNGRNVFAATGTRLRSMPLAGK